MGGAGSAKLSYQFGCSCFSFSISCFLWIVRKFYYHIKLSVAEFIILISKKSFNIDYGSNSVLTD